MAHYISYNLLDRFCYLDNCRNSRANTCNKLGPGQLGKGAFTRGETNWGESSKYQMSYSKFSRESGANVPDDANEFLPYQLSTAG